LGDKQSQTMVEVILCKDGAICEDVVYSSNQLSGTLFPRMISRCKRWIQKWITYYSYWPIGDFVLLVSAILGSVEVKVLVPNRVQSFCEPSKSLIEPQALLPSEHFEFPLFRDQQAGRGASNLSEKLTLLAGKVSVSSQNCSVAPTFT
jgi:hypothetical protein